MSLSSLRNTSSRKASRKKPGCLPFVLGGGALIGLIVFASVLFVTFYTPSQSGSTVVSTPTVSSEGAANRGDLLSMNATRLALTQQVAGDVLPATAPRGTAEPVMQTVAPPIAFSGDALSAADRHLIDTSNSSITASGSFQATWAGQINLSQGGQSIVIDLHGTGAFGGFSTDSGDPRFDLTTTVRLPSGTSNYQFDFAVRLVGGRGYIQVTAESDGRRQELPWAYLDIENALNNLLAAGGMGAVVPDMSAGGRGEAPDIPGNLELADLERFSNLFSLGEYIRVQRMPDEEGGQVARFRAEYDFIGYFSSSQFLQAVQALLDITGESASMDINMMSMVLLPLLQETLPRFDVVISQYVNLSDDTLNRYTLDIDLIFDQTRLVESGLVVADESAASVPPVRINIDMLVSFSNLGAPVTVIEPADAIPLEELNLLITPMPPD